ncbi:MAG: hypothetical protein LKE37_04520 [Atopobiaceae bacterium]|jgi:hypothetical protein|nr:hypothetical protein [Atopobiaceae bacterium]
MPDATERQLSEFQPGAPVLVCRWRLANRCLPLENRHLRALAARRVCGEPVSQNLLAWAKQHIEWNLETGAVEHPDGVLMLVVDDKGQAAMSVGEYVPLPNASAIALAARASSSLAEADASGVAPETLWAVRGDTLVAGVAVGQPLSGAASLVVGLAETVGTPVARDGGLSLAAPTDSSELFLVSDEHGIVPASDAPGPHSATLATGYQRLLDQTKRKGR